MYFYTRRKIWTSFSCLVLLKCYHVVFSQFKFPANLAQLVVPKMHCMYANAVVQSSGQHCQCYKAWKTKVHTWCRHCHLCINAPMWREKRWLQGLFDPPLYITVPFGQFFLAKFQRAGHWIQFIHSCLISCSLIGLWVNTRSLYWKCIMHLAYCFQTVHSALVSAWTSHRLIHIFWVNSFILIML